MVLEDREYMRPSFGGPSGGLKLGRSPVLMLIAVNVVVFFATAIGGGRLITSFALRLPDWSQASTYVNSAIGLFAYQFLHGDTSHIFWNMLFLFVFGRCFEEKLTKIEFWRLYLGAGAIAGVFWLIVDATSHSILLGASGAVFGIMVAAAFLEPNKILMLFFVIPIRLKWAVMLAMATTLFLFRDQRIGNVPSDVSHLAHLGGAIGGYLMLLMYQRDLIQLRWSDLFDLSSGKRKTRKKKAARGTGKRPIPVPRGPKNGSATTDQAIDSDPFLKIDPILDKIGKHGMKSLTKKEKQLLDRARKKLK